MTMNRRQAIRFAVSFVFAADLGKLDAFAAGSKSNKPTGVLTVDLNEWAAVVFKFGGKKVAIPVAEVFASLEEGPCLLTR